MQLANPIDAERDHVKGAIGAPLSLVEYGDFECPYCRQAYYELATVRRRMGNELCIVFRNFPLSRIHPHALAAAEAAEAAGAQGRFWQMHDLLYEHQGQLEQPDLLRYAGRLGLDLDAFSDALSSHALLARIRDDFASGVRSGVNGTPCFFINGQRHDGPWDTASLIVALENLLYSSTVIPASR